ncbi:Excinuclease ABC C subunit domain protein [Desulfotomaculum nigrificans CO-1-SRB]|uniref:Excinuclease ABC C subunit domain protein n=1 Tax=Desulfotomaculum nigrificans (strain DSM 14880 / VKM B-2319 / CO-1-SRB) TaxID=868595 RepID=F6B9V7_DESCC|nr:GIY-YIG nuclease family protein [Desulfotomaculum nigrificans]AEF93805.1 Excinuclease ABC C subunit domain protein [Desulfotomaculum nigrificans CO-1-SRB]
MDNHMKEQLDYVVYILKCSDNTLYTGITNNLEQRLAMHRQGKASKYTRARLPVKLVHVEYGFSKGQALSRERKIKKLSREQKLLLINSPDL